MKFINTATSLFMLVAVISACQPFDNGERKYPSTIGTFNVTGEFIINPTTILDTLDHGKTNVFTPALATPTEDSILPSGSIQWTQSEYLKVANALSQSVWNESLEDWSVYYLAFNRECQDNPKGFDDLTIIYYKTITVNMQKVYTARIIEIFPLASNVSWGGETNFPISSGWNEIDPSKFKITADDALRIAEENGGKEARLKLKNHCDILVRAPNHSNDDSWDVGYYYGVDFELIIDPFSGHFQTPTQSP